MGLKAWVADIREVQRNLSELLAADTAEEEAASLELAQSASRFSRRTRKVVDDKLSFSATLMRAGEVSAATRLLAEIERDVRSEEIALIETVNEVKVAQAVRRGRITRLRLARSFAVAMLGACVLAFSAVGMAVAGAFDDRDQARALAPLRRNAAGAARIGADGRRSPAAQRLIRRLQIGNVKLVLTADEYRRLTALTGGDVDQAGLNDVLGLLTGALAQKVEQAMTAASDVVDTAESTLAIDAAPAVKKVNRVKKKAERQSAEEAPPPEDEGSSQGGADQGSGSQQEQSSGEETQQEEEKEGDEAGNSEEGGTTTPDLPTDA
ncbi:MAG: hypothetical protein M3N53_10155 [Actinomycetota bacterium]|nr:hypothetical protein [Actinomycetota bacterium]